MEINIKETAIVRPAEETPKKRLWVSNLDLFMVTVHVSTVYFYRRPKDCSNFFEGDVLKEALSKVLVPFYPVAGRLGRDENGRLEIQCNAEGVLFIEAETSCCVDDLGDFTPSPKLHQLVPTIDQTKDISSFPLLLLQATHFKCGGVSLGVGFQHTLADGMSALHFINSWADMTRGFPVNCLPFIDRTIFREEAKVHPNPKFHHIEFDPPLSLNNTNAIEPQLSPKPTSVATLKLSLDQINTLKAKTMKDQHKTNIKYSTYEILSAHIWRCTCKARGLSNDQASKLYINIDGRARLNPPLPLGFLGNAIFFTTPITLSCDIKSRPLTFTLEKIHEAIKQMDSEYLNSALAYLEHNDPTTLRHRPHFFKSPNLKIISWMRLPIYDADFGWGPPIFMGLTKVIFEGLSIILPSAVKDGSLSVVISLDSQEIVLFKKFFYEF